MLTKTFQDYFDFLKNYNVSENNFVRFTHPEQVMGLRSPLVVLWGELIDEVDKIYEKCLLPRDAILITMKKAMD